MQAAVTGQAVRGKHNQLNVQVEHALPNATDTCFHAYTLTRWGPKKHVKCVKRQEAVRQNSHWLAGRQRQLGVGSRQEACRWWLVLCAWTGAQLPCTQSCAPPTETTPSSAPSGLFMITTLNTSALNSGPERAKQKWHQIQAVKLPACTKHDIARCLYSETNMGGSN